MHELAQRLRWKIRHYADALAVSVLSMAQLERIVRNKINRAGHFTFNNEELPYFFHSYNNFGITERAIEIPLVRSFLLKKEYCNILEIGNVTQHYYDHFRDILPSARRTIIDKFETGPGILNVDIGSFTVRERFDFVFSISTFEHMDSDLGRNPSYQPGSATLVSIAADNIHHVSRDLILPGGTFILTAPLGYTPEWDATFFSSDLARCGFSAYRKYVFRRTGEMRWVEVDPELARHAESSSFRDVRDYLSVLECVK